ncbi:hypothetical protein PV326_009725 [Microctonus aethiopoides]|nr:hypothetical protein PV326_009725 [Microctonus aethiopoides]
MSITLDKSGGDVTVITICIKTLELCLGHGSLGIEQSVTIPQPPHREHCTACKRRVHVDDSQGETAALEKNFLRKRDWDEEKHKSGNETRIRNFSSPETLFSRSASRN